MLNLKNLKKAEREKLAIAHTKRMLTTMRDEINDSISKTSIMTNDDNLKELSSKNMNSKFDTKIKVTDNDTLTETFNYPYDEKIAILNFASFKHPGGKFYDGSSAQEEFICHHSTLYPVLSEFKTTYYVPHAGELNYALYEDEALYSPNIVVFNYDDPVDLMSDMNFYPVSDARSVNVITCAAPNASAFIRFKCQNKPSKDDLKLLEDTMYNRCKFILDIAAIKHDEVLILGAFGCGVFGNKASIVSKIFKSLLDNEYKGIFKEVVFAIPVDSTGNNEDFRITFNC